ncbi:PAQR family membrane homeostasis protein TrhA [Rubrobacter indicoceani]|uniref:PAQR family membrane homeostasis protein TrhA n=1 Tax=Rubrobacter indicoceani TaxID=2051957 RepID=UPI000E5A48E5|nr:hemolysin III family protein [Rubrobacter indicoceani]
MSETGTDHPKPRYTKAEELANTLTHGAGLIGSIVGAVLLIVLTATGGDGWQLASSIVYGGALIALYAASTLYHALPSPRQKRVMRILDHSAIYVLIAGTYTPFALVVLREEGRSWALFGAIWTIAVVGVVLKILFTGRLNVLSTAAYVLMGWLCVVVARPLVESLPTAALVLLASGGVAYTAGVAFYANRKLPFSHAIWHGFVVAGSVLQFFAIYHYVLVPAT